MVYTDHSFHSLFTLLSCASTERRSFWLEPHNLRSANRQVGKSLNTEVYNLVDLILGMDISL